ncbi:MAG: hypothetical protein RIA69_19455 [Cyclobacteriaceae bacterium]
MQLSLIAVYIWSGIHKVHPNFVNTNFENIIQTYFQFVDKELLKAYLFIGYLAPVFEIAVGLFLFIPKTRTIGIIMALLLHAFIIAYLSPVGIDYNSIVIPWNVAMALMVVSLFHKKQPIDWRSIVSKLGNKYLQFALMLVLIMPTLSAFQLWDHYLSFSLYSNKTPHFYVASEYNSFGPFNDSTEPFIKKIKPIRGSSYLDINAWCMSILNVPFYPEKRVFKQLSKHFCQSDPNPDKLLFVILQPHWNSETIHSFSCE